MGEQASDLRGGTLLTGGSLFPPFREFYRDHNPQFRGAWPCPLGTPLPELHVAMADTIADYMDAIASVMSAKLMAVA